MSAEKKKTLAEKAHDEWGKLGPRANVEALLNKMAEELEKQHEEQRENLVEAYKAYSETKPKTAEEIFREKLEKKFEWHENQESKERRKSR